ncbi:MAG: multidrug resistance protein family [Chloroflexota bacterium]|nr:multidrug resistance protein family [Chloroflexota bacterium]
MSSSFATGTTESRSAIWRRELSATVTLAAPVAFAELGGIAMGVVDTMVLGRVSTEAMGAGSIGGVYFFALSVFGMGMLFGLDTLVSQAFGAGRLDECHRWLIQGLYLTILVTPPLMALVWLGGPALSSVGINPVVLALADPYLRVLSWSMFPMVLHAALRRYMQAIGLVRPIVVAVVVNNVINLVLNWILVFGHFGFPALGVEGSALATTLSRGYLALGLVAAIIWHEVRQPSGLRHVPLAPDLKRLGRIVALGAPAAMQFLLEVGGFSAITTMAGKLDAASLAAHQIALNVASIAFMVPFGVSSAAAVRVGQAIGRGDPAGAARAGWVAFILGPGFMLAAAIAELTLRGPIVSLFSADPAVLEVGMMLLVVAASFSIFDGLQTVGTGVLRGTGDTRTSLLCNVLCFWLVGIPLAVVLGFGAGLGVAGLWAGTAIGLGLLGTTLLVIWSRRAPKLAQVKLLA